ncbi:netrin-4 isoform X2 [Ranitomeya imitator]|uniref:netrin-4 isoform X2 n=1 Tax=Ranitomeya imitator TaxID=111125 RepID=UPI0037E8F579
MSAIGITGRSHPAPGICSYVPVTMEALLSLLTLLAASALATGINTITFATIASQREKACNPRMGNLAIGRSLWTDTVCGTNSTELYCTYTAYPDQTCKEPKCEKCNAAVPRLSHPASAMADSTFKIPRTWWQSARDIQREIIQLHLETTFYFTHLIMVFKSPRPAAMILEGSQDFGVSWRPYKYFSTDCTETFQLEDDINVKGAPCTSRYSQVLPCSGGEVIYRAMPPPYTAVDPYSEKAQDLLKITNLRVQLLKQQSCPCQNKSWDIKPQSLAYYAVYDFIVKGSCFCNGHADHCVPIDGFQQVQTTSKLQVVHGQCICKHNTAGPHCEQCAPLYNDRAWKAANGKTGEPNMCEKCKCNDHADSCRFDMDVWLASGNQSGGACNNCQHNTEGIHCEKCAPGFFRDLKIPFSAPDACKACSCHPVGSAKLSFSNHTLCDPQNGNCPCKPGVAGPICDRCMVGYWGFGEYGCRPCACPGNCDSFTGDCITNLEVDWYHGPDFLSSEQGFSALRHSGKCECKDQVLENAKVFCDMRYSYVLKVKILSAHDKGSHAEVIVKIKKVLKMTKLKIPRGKRILYPESWTNRGCTCPILNPGLEYLVAGYEDVRTGHLIVNMKSFVQPWKPSIGKKVMEILSKDCY